jgi:hypothetical protein
MIINLDGQFAECKATELRLYPLKLASLEGIDRLTHTRRSIPGRFPGKPIERAAGRASHCPPKDTFSLCEVQRSHMDVYGTTSAFSVPGM